MPNQDPINHDDDLMPHWARGTCSGQLVIGAQMPTRDGRRCGNGHIIDIQRDSPLGTLYVILTDAGTQLRLTEGEVAWLYYPPKWISNVEEVKKKFTDRDQLPE